MATTKTTAKKTTVKATAKPADKKTTTKTTAKTAAKPAAKPAAKKTTAKPATKATEISVSGNKKIRTLEQEFDKVFGLYAQVCYTNEEGHRYYTSGSNDEKTLASFNEECEEKGCKKNVYR